MELTNVKIDWTGKHARFNDDKIAAKGVAVFKDDYNWRCIGFQHENSKHMIYSEPILFIEEFNISGLLDTCTREYLDEVSFATHMVCVKI